MSFLIPCEKSPSEHGVGRSAGGRGCREEIFRADEAGIPALVGPVLLMISGRFTIVAFRRV
ncbi:predicted protein [Streptomyces sp. SPB78]|nr:predicted protein [Streptomyces sp. SPB78]